MAKNKAKTKEEKRQAEKTRYNKIKDDPVKYEEQKQKEILKYLKKIILDHIASTTKATSLHFLSDGPATQYRNKTMFYFLANKLHELYPPMKKFTWNYSESGQGKGAPDVIGGTVKRTADRLVAKGTDLMDFNILLQKLEENCPGIRVFLIKNEDIDVKSKESEFKNNLPFSGTLKVHQICGNHQSSRLKMRTLSCFGCEDCHHFELGIIDYHQPRLRLISCSSNDSFGVNIRGKFEPSTAQKGWTYADVYNSSEDETNSTRQLKSLKAATFIAQGVKDKKQSRHAAICQKDPKDKKYKLLNF